MDRATKTGPIEVSLRQVNLDITCTIVHDDESTRELDADSLSMRGAQREMTGYFISQGNEPVGRWEAEGPAETVGRFTVKE
ncbi:MAG: hypothetical protein ACRDSM_08775 [Pseudonocardiaceae bacterium]